MAFPPAAAIARPVQMIIQPAAEGQFSNMIGGGQIIVSQAGGSEIRMRLPESVDDDRIEVAFLFTNLSDQPVAVGPEGISATTITYLPTYQLAEDQRRREGRRKFGNVLVGMLNGLAAANAGTEYSSFSYSGSTGYGSSYSGSGTITTYNAAAAQIAQERAQARMEERTDRMHQSFAQSRDIIAGNLRATTVYPNQRVSGILTFSVPKAAKSERKPKEMTIAINFGGERHVFNGFVGQVGTMPLIKVSALPPLPSPPARMAAIASSPLPQGRSGSGPTSGLAFGTMQRAPLSPNPPPSEGIDNCGQCEQLANLAKQGSAPAQNELGTLYQLGRGVKQDNAIAVRYFRLAATQGHRQAQSNLAWMYETGQGVPKSKSMAMRFYNLAARNGDSLARQKVHELQTQQEYP